MPETQTACPLDCPDSCSLTVEAQEDRITRIRGDHRNPLTAGFICDKVAKFGDRVHGPHRVRTPLIRSGPKGSGSFREASWDEALDLVAAQLRSALPRPGSVVPVYYGGSNGKLTGGGLDLRFWRALGACALDATLCATNAGAGVSAVYPGLASADPLDAEASDCVVVWGFNPDASGIHLLPLLRRLQTRGGKLVVVDPRRTATAARADLHLAPRPGTDVALALAVAGLAFTNGTANRAFLTAECDDTAAFEAAARAWTPARAEALTGVPAASIEALAALYAASARPLIRTGWGIERSRNGSDALRAIVSLPAVFGKFGLRGQGYVASTSGGYKKKLAAIGTLPGSPPAPRTVNLSQLGRELERPDHPRIEFVYVYNCNPAVTVPDQQRVVAALTAPDRFVVVHEQVLTDTARLADVVLPATTFLEHDDLATAYGGYVVAPVRPAIDAVGEARPNRDVFAALAARLADVVPLLGDPSFARPPAGELREIAQGIEGAGVEATVAGELTVLPRPVQFVDSRPTRRVSFTRNPAGEDIGPPGAARLQVSATDAAARGIRTGDRVRIWNTLGEVHLRADVSDHIAPGVVSAPKGLWRSGTLNGWTTNTLIADHVDAQGRGACYNDARVELVRVE